MDEGMLDGDMPQKFLNLIAGWTRYFPSLIMIDSSKWGDHQLDWKWCKESVELISFVVMRTMIHHVKLIKATEQWYYYGFLSRYKDNYERQVKFASVRMIL
jgi:hypothetical protein